MNPQLLTLVPLLLAATPPPATPSPPATKRIVTGDGASQEATDRTLIRRAAEAFRNGDDTAALEHLGRLRTRHPLVAEIPYNMGVSAHRAGDQQRAEELFRDAMTIASDPALRARSAYNLGTTAYERSREAATASPEAIQEIDAASEALADALEQFRSALDHDPHDDDAKANGELTQRQIRMLEQLKEQLEQQQSQQQQDQQQQDQQQQDQQQQDQQQQDQQQQDQQPPDRQEQDRADRSDEGDQQQDEPDGQSSEQPGDDQERDRAQAEANDQRKPMSREEADRLLQMVRDKDRQRQEELRSNLRRKLPPVERDW